MSNDILFNISDIIADAMVLLDPPNLPHKSNKVTPQNVKDAYDLMLSINLKDINQYELLPQDDWNDKSTPVVEPISSQSTVGVIADFYRTVILASSLLLELCYWCQNSSYNQKEYGNLKRDQAEVLCETIIHSIHRLRRMSTIVSCSYQHYLKMKNTSDDALVAALTKDWHDDILTKSQYPLLQECFERQPMMDIETNTTFGMSRRIISLHPDDYICENVMSITEDDDDEFSPIDDNEKIQKYDESMLPPMMMDPKQLEKEELELLYIALPNSSLRSRNKSTTTILKHLDETLEMCIQSLSRYRLCHHIHLPFQLGPCKILKSSPIIVKEIDNQRQMEMHLFANGVILLHKNDYNSTMSVPSESLNMWKLSPDSTCSPVHLGLTFHFSVKSVNNVINHPTLHSCSLTLAVDESKGGSLKEGCDWIHVFQMAISNIRLL